MNIHFQHISSLGVQSTLVAPNVVVVAEQASTEGPEFCGDWTHIHVICWFLCTTSGSDPGPRRPSRLCGPAGWSPPLTGVLCFHLCSWPFPPSSFVHTCSLWGAFSQLSLGALAIVSRSCQISPPPWGRFGRDLPIAISIPMNSSHLKVRRVCTTLLSPALGPGVVNLLWPDDIPLHQMLQKNCGVFLMPLIQVNSALSFFGCFSSFPLTVAASHSQPPWAST